MEVARPKKKTKAKKKTRKVVEERSSEGETQETQEETIDTLTAELQPEPVSTPSPLLPTLPTHNLLDDSTTDTGATPTTTGTDNSDLIVFDSLSSRTEQDRPSEEFKDNNVPTTVDDVQLTTPTVESTNQMTAEREDGAVHLDEEQQVIIEEDTVTNEEDTVPVTNEVVTDEVVLPTAPVVVYPTLDSLIAASSVTDSVIVPFSEDDLSLLYPNPQLAANQDYVDNFIKESQQEDHPLYELLKQYLKARLSSKTTERKLKNLRQSYSQNDAMIWTITDKRISSNGRCSDGKSISHNHSHKYAEINTDAVYRTEETLKSLRDTLQEEFVMTSYSAQLAYIHVEFYIHQLLHSLPELVDMPQNGPVTDYIPHVPPGSMDDYTYHLRSSISVLFIFERRPSQDKQFSSSCRYWLNTLISGLLRVASLPDHLFLINHILRCPPGVADWAIGFIQPLSPLRCKGVERKQDTNGVGGVRGGVSMEWKLSSPDYSWDGPIIDHWVTMLSTLFQPIMGREEFLSFFSPTSPSVAVRQESQPWTFVEEDEDDEDSRSNDRVLQLMLQETDYISLLDQFPITDIFKYLLCGREGNYTGSANISSYQMLQFISFCTCLIRLFGRVFSILRHSAYKGFIKQVGRTIRQIVHYVADHWANYRGQRLAAGETMGCLPSGEDPVMRYSLERLQVEFDQFVLRATQWILTAHKLGAWQFMADMPYGSLSSLTLWKILWTLYHYQMTTHKESTGGTDDPLRERRGSVLTDRTDLDHIPENPHDIIQSIRSSSCHGQFVDVLMKTYTSEVIFLLTTFVNMARSRDPEEEETEKEFINFIAQEIFQFTQVENYTSDAYSRTGHTLLDSVARVHPFVISTLLEETRKQVEEAGENCILLFKELPLHLWLPSDHDISLVREWLVTSSLTSPQHLIAKVIISGLNWGIKDTESGSGLLVLSPSVHRDIALSVIELWYHHFTDDSNTTSNKTLYSSTINRISKSIRSLLANDMSDLLSWLWDIILMLKLHPSQHTGLQSSSNEQPPEGGGAKNPAVYKRPVGVVPEGALPPIDNPGVSGFELLRECVLHEGLIAFYVKINVTNTGTDSHQFLSDGLPMLVKLADQGYYLPVLKLLGHVTPLMFENRKLFIEEQNFISLILSVVNADNTDVSIKEKLTWTIPSPHIIRRFSALITSQIHCQSSSESELIFLFWLEVLFSIPSWLRQPNVLYVLNNLCIVGTVREHLRKILIEKLLEQYRFLKPFQTNKRLVSSVTSSVLSMIGQEGGPPSLFSAIDSSEYPWLAYYSLLSEEEFEEQEGVWLSLLKQLKKDPKISIDNALKKTLSDLGHSGSSFISSHLCIYRWANLCTSLDNSFILLPLVWQRFFALYLQRPVFSASMPERGSLGLRFFSTNRSQSTRRAMKSTLSKTFRTLQEEQKGLSRGREKEKENVFIRELLPKLISYYQTLKMWLEEPRLHEETLSLPSLPIQYEPDRLAKAFKTQQTEWVEFVRLWEIEEIIEVMLDEWKQVELYQKQLSTQSEAHDQSPDTAAARIEKRLSYCSSPASPPPFIFPPAPFSLLPTTVLLSRTDLLSTVLSDINYIAQQGRTYSERFNAMVALDSEYITGIPDLYSNQPRQFHVSVPCHKAVACTGPATIVFRFNEMTPHSHWEQRIPQNRLEQAELLKSLSCPVSFDLCKAVARTEHVVGELSKLSESKDSEALSNGVALFYEVLKFITSETKQFPPSCQFLTSCIEILGQEFILRDPSQTATILQLLLSQRSLGGILAPLFDPNLCPPDFISMYTSVREIAIKEGASIAFSALTKFNVTKWLSDYSPSPTDCSQLLQCIFQGISYCGRDPSNDLLVLCEGYTAHFGKLLEYQFPLLYNEALHLIIDGTDTGGISSHCWQELSSVTTPTSSVDSDTCRLGLQLLQESMQYLSSFYTQKRLYTKETIYELVSSEYVTHILQFILMLCTSLINKLVTSVDLEVMTIDQALSQCWHGVVDIFRAWIFPLHIGETNEIIFPCKFEVTDTLGDNIKLFVHSISLLQEKFNVSGGYNALHLFWVFYCNELALPNTPLHILECYHANLVSLPWQLYTPDIPAMDLMIKLKISKDVSQLCFVFLGEIFPLFNWKEISSHYNSDPSHSIQFQITFLQLLVMLAADSEIMKNKDSRVPDLISEAKSFDFHCIDLKTYQEILEWQKNNCTPSSVLQTGSALSLSLRMLKVAGSFPINSKSKPLLLHKDGWDKRCSFIRLVVEIVSVASQYKETHSNSYSDVISFILQTLIDTIVFEPESLATINPVLLLQEALNLFNTCHPSEPFVSSLVSHVTDCLDQLPNAPRLHLPTVTAASRVLVSIPLMVQLVENVITVFFKHYSPPNETTLQLPPRMDGYGWSHLSSSLTIPQTAIKEFSSVCVEQFACYCLNTRLLHQLPRCSSLEEELDILINMVRWCTSLKPKPNEEHKMFVIWEKVFNLLLRQIKYGGNTNAALNQFTSLANTLQRFGEDKATEGLLGAIGLGKKSIYSLEFRLISRVLATFIHTQMPLDSSQSVHPRLLPNAPGHIKDPQRHTPGFTSVAMATKQADQASASLESLLSNKSYIHLRDYVSYSLDMINDLKSNLMNIPDLFVYLVINLYPLERSLDALRVAQT